MSAASQQQQPPQPTQAVTRSSAEEEALKRNTDCVYFLASPLTCKKGSECEYRHSEYARVNPRDCYFWLNGNCLNPKCMFRHPPLDGLLGVQAASSSGSSFPPQTATTSATPASFGKQAVPCIFFQKGFCMKGDRCAFLHGPSPTSDKGQNGTAAVPVTESLSLKKSFSGIGRCGQGQKNSQEHVIKPVEASAISKSSFKAEPTSAKDGVGTGKSIRKQNIDLDQEHFRHKDLSMPPVVNVNSVRHKDLSIPVVSENSVSKSSQNHVSENQNVQGVKDADECFRESSPGFDVLVDGELGDSDYYHNDDQYGRARSHEGRKINSVNEYDNYSSVADVDQEMFPEPNCYGSYDHLQGQYGWEQRGASSERISGGLSHIDRKNYPKSGASNHIDESDLRYHLSKQRRVGDLRSVVIHDSRDEERITQNSWRESKHSVPRENSLSSRLRGRVKLPERDIDRGRNWGRLSPGRPSSQQGRLRDRIKGRIHEDCSNEGRNFRSPGTRREIVENKLVDFAGPKRLAELKDKGRQMKGQQSLPCHQNSQSDLSFEGPKPLSEILKRKREAGAAASESGPKCVGGVDNDEKEAKRSLLGSPKNQSIVTSLSKQDLNNNVASNEEESKSLLADAHGAEDKPSQVNDVSTDVNEDGMIVEEGVGDHESDPDDSDGDYNYEQVDDGDYNYEEGENIDGEEENVEDEDGDDFAKKIGVMFS